MSNGHEYTPVAENHGESAIGVGVQDDMVVIRLAEPMDLLGMTPEEAVHIAMALMRAACQIKPELEDGLPAPEADETLLAWAYSKLQHVTFTKQEDALQLDRIKLLLEHGIVA